MAISKNRGAFAITLLAAATAVSLAGCGSAPAAPTTSVPPATSSAPEPSATTPAEPLTFLTWTGGDAGKKWENVAAAYESATGVAVKIEVIPSETYDQVLTSRIEAGNAPDLIETIVEKQDAFVGGGLLADLSGEPWVANNIPAVQDFKNFYDGKTYAFIGALDVAGVFYNVNLFNEQGLEVPTTWDAFKDAVIKLRAAGITPLASGGKDSWTLNVQANQMSTGALFGTGETIKLRSGELKFSESKWKDILTDWYELIKMGAYDKQVLGIDWPSSANQFAAGEAAMLIQGSFALPAVREANPDMNVGLFALPYGGSEPVASVNYGSMLAVPAAAKNQEGAKAFLNFLADPANLGPFLADAKAFSSFVGVTTDLDPALNSIADLVETNSAEYNLTPGTSAAVNSAIGTGVQGLMGGTMTVAEVLDSMDRAQAGS